MDKKKDIKFYLVPGLIFFTFLLRLVVVSFYKDTSIDNEWGILLNNLVNYKAYSFYTFENNLIPSVYMPPLYLFFIFFLKFITLTDNGSLIYTIIFSQILLSTFSVYIFYEFNKSFFSEKVSLINAFVFSIIPINVYACGQISSIILQIFLSIAFLYLMLLIIKKSTFKNVTMFSITSGLLILTRGEFLLIFGLIILLIFINKEIKFSNFIKIFLIVTIIISPYLIRNYIHFNELFLVKSSGYNLWKGNNELSKVEGFEDLNKKNFSILASKIKKLEKNKYYEINRDNIFLDHAVKNIQNDFVRYVNLFFKKFFSYYFIDLNSSYPNYYNFFHIFPILIISILSFPGFFISYKTKKNQNNYLGIYLILNLLIFSIFFILPRYKLIILPVQIIFAAYFVIYLLKKLKKKKKFYL